MNETKCKDAQEPSRREALETLGNVAKYVAPATLLLVSSASAAGSVQ